MKKLSLVLVTLVIFLSAGISVLAETIEKKDVDVTAQYIQTAEGFNQGPVKNGEGSLITEEDIKVSVSDAPGTARRLVVYPISKNSDGGRWLIKCLNGKGNFICAYDIYFLDEAGNRINAEGTTVTIDSLADAANLEFYSVSTDGTAAVPDYSVKNSSVTFTVLGNSYYVFVEKTPSNAVITITPTQVANNTGTGSGSGSQANNQSSTKSNTLSKVNSVPKTADNTNAAGFVIMLAISAAVAGMALKKKSFLK